MRNGSYARTVISRVSLAQVVAQFPQESLEKCGGQESGVDASRRRDRRAVSRADRQRSSDGTGNQRAVSWLRHECPHYGGCKYGITPGVADYGPVRRNAGCVGG